MLRNRGAGRRVLSFNRLSVGRYGPGVLVADEPSLIAFAWTFPPSYTGSLFTLFVGASVFLVEVLELKVLT